MSREIKILTPENVELTFELAGLGSRFIAILLDSLIQSLFALFIFLVFLLLVVSGVDFSSFEKLSPWVIAIISLGMFILFSQYFLYFEATKNGQTPGKKAVGIRVILDTGHPVDFRTAFLRNIMRIVDFLPGFYTVGVISIFASSEYRRLGDYTAGTLVVKTGKQHQAAINVAREHNKPWYTPEQGFEMPEPEPSTLPQASLSHLHSITKDEYRAVRHFLDRRKELDEGVARNLAEKMMIPIAAKLHIERTDIADPVSFLDSLAREWERRMIH